MLNKMRYRVMTYGATGVKRSTRKNKKYMVLYKDKWIHYGDSRYQDFTQHKDSKRRDSYLKRARGIKNKKGQKTYMLKTSPNFWAYWTL